MLSAPTIMGRIFYKIGRKTGTTTVGCVRMMIMCLF